jgi:hypothetical protein
MGNWASSSKPNDDAGKKLQQEREEYQAQLRAMILNEDVIDWEAVISKADALHRREQAWLKRRSRGERIWLRKKQRQALQRRRQHDAIGSFKMNLITYRLADIYPGEHDEETQINSNPPQSVSIAESSQDDAYMGSFPKSRFRKDSLDPINERPEVLDAHVGSSV